MGFAAGLALVGYLAFLLVSTIVLALFGVILFRVVRMLGGPGGLAAMFSRKARVEARHLVIRGPHYPHRVLRVRRWLGLPAMPRRKSGRWGK